MGSVFSAPLMDVEKHLRYEIQKLKRESEQKIKEKETYIKEQNNKIKTLVEEKENVEIQLKQSIQQTAALKQNKKSDFGQFSPLTLEDKDLENTITKIETEKNLIIDELKLTVVNLQKEKESSKNIMRQNLQLIKEIETHKQKLEATTALVNSPYMYNGTSDVTNFNTYQSNGEIANLYNRLELEQEKNMELQLKLNCIENSHQNELKKQNASMKLMKGDMDQLIKMAQNNGIEYVTAQKYSQGSSIPANSTDDLSGFGMQEQRKKLGSRNTSYDEVDNTRVLTPTLLNGAHKICVNKIKTDEDQSKHKVPILGNVNFDENMSQFNKLKYDLVQNADSIILDKIRQLKGRQKAMDTTRDKETDEDESQVEISQLTDIFIKTRLSGIRDIRNFTVDLEKQVKEFFGSETSKEYLHLQEMLIRMMVLLDNVESGGFDEIRQERKATSLFLKKCIDDLHCRTCQL